MKKLILTILILSIFEGFTNAQFFVTGEYRPRAEFRNGYKSLSVTDQEDAYFISQRTRLNIIFNNEYLRTKLTLQDIRTWGSEPQLAVTDGLSSIHEAWGEILFNKEISLKIGRQEIIYDDQRIFGNVGWAQQARSHDIALFKIEKSFKLHLGLAWNQDKEQLNTNFYTVANYKSLQFVWFNKIFGRYSLSALVLNNGIENKVDNIRRINYSQTFGQRSVYITDKFTGTLNFYIQTGKDATHIDLFAYNARIDLDYKISDNMKAIAGYELLSGNDMVNPDASKNKSFTPLYGTNHKFNGWMDYFYVGNHANNVGLQDVFFGLSLNHKKWNIQLHNHIFMASAPVKNPITLTKASGYLGDEIDITAKYNFTKDINFSVGYSHMLQSESMTFVKGMGDKNATNNWAWCMISITPSFFNSSK